MPVKRNEQKYGMLIEKYWVWHVENFYLNRFV